MAYGKDYPETGNPFEAKDAERSPSFPKSEIAAFLSAVQREATINREMVIDLAKRLSPIINDSPVMERGADAMPCPGSQLANELQHVASQVSETNRTLASLMDRLCI